MKLNAVLKDLPVYQPGRPIEEVARELGLPADDIIKLASNENPLGPSPRALRAMAKAVRQVHLYPDGNAYYLKQKMAARLGLTPGHILLGNGSNEIIEFIGHALVEPGVEVVVSQYCFAIYPIITKMFGGTVVEVPAKNYGHDLAAMLRAVTPRTRVIFIANPNNPTGTRASNRALQQLVREAPEHVLVVLDEAYIEFLEDPADFLPLLRAGKQKNLMLMRTFSKIYGLAGLRLGYGLGHPEIIAALEKIRQPFNINSVAQAAALAAFDDTRHIERTRRVNRQGLAYYAEAFDKMGLEYVPSSGNFVLVRVGEGQRMFEALQRRGVITRPMGGYRLPEWLRISVGTAAENRRCVAALKEALAEMRSN
ncbi:histidinol-phosphate transaminase [Fontisphaera persica]|uniref:histidinol-phosphate transaminase n=1 Tax=Fontisphaera persica TaxID=2974023 RepID=UPI0024BF841A|nr:histidinol-phosphate transaminase [Fontisphaera persica]WCJ60636.1 histidinol-phosphate transaminase [Fontisphaera persica]